MMQKILHLENENRRLRQDLSVTSSDLHLQHRQHDPVRLLKCLRPA